MNQVLEEGLVLVRKKALGVLMGGQGKTNVWRWRIMALKCQTLNVRLKIKDFI